MESTNTISDRDYTRLSEFIYNECGIKLPPAKKTMLVARLQKRLRSLDMKSFGDYIDYLFGPDGIRDEMVRMIDLITTNKTDFFREPGHFNFLLQRVLPEWVEEHGGSGRKLMIWSAGCSTGEEPYTLAMVLNEFAENCPGFDYRILGTDISTRVLEKAEHAVYEEERIAPVPSPLKRKYLLCSKDRRRGLVRIVPELREKVRFRRLNFMDENFGMREPMDIIFCRNVIIYFDRQTQERLLNKFYAHLRNDGFIFMGHSETLNGLNIPLVMVHPTVYKKRK